MLAHVIGWEEFLFLIVLVTIWPMNCEDVLKPIHKVGQTQHQRKTKGIDRGEIVFSSSTWHETSFMLNRSLKK
jgi:hypothetical protein